MKGTLLLVLLLSASASGLPSLRSKRLACQSQHISSKNSSREQTELLNKLKKCHVIFGHLWLEDLLLRHNASFPNLVQVTDFVVLLNVRGFESLPKLLPSLSVVRGRKLHKGYGFILDGLCSHEFCLPKDKPHEDLGVIRIKAVTSWSFLKLLRGGIWLNNNKLVCLPPVRYWKDSVGESFVKNIYYKNNLDYCPLQMYCEEENCYNSPKSCKSLPQRCPYEDEIATENCHHFCIEGRCTKPNDSASCVACKDFLHEGKCVDKCPKDTSLYFGYHCVSHAECHELSGIVFLDHVRRQRSEQLEAANAYADQCVTECPNGFVRKLSNETMTWSCQLRNDSDNCSSTTLKNGDLGDSLRYCEIINGDLVINIDKGMEDENDVEKLSKNLRKLKEITGSLRIVGANVFFSLYFLSNLKRIGSKVDSSFQGENRYALFILNNINLKELWNPILSDSGLEINGPILIKYNDQLCDHEVENFKKAINLTEFVTGNNGATAQCNIIHTELFGEPGQDYGTVKLRWYQQYEGNTDLYVIGYEVFYRLAPGNSTLTRYQGRQACADVWSKKQIELPKGIQNGCFDYTVGNLTTNTRYAFYIQTFGFPEDPTIIMSDIIYISTYPERPDCPRKGRSELGSNKLLEISWKPPLRISGHPFFYEIQVRFIDQASSVLHLVPSETCEEFENRLLQMKRSFQRHASQCTRPNSTQDLNTSSIKAASDLCKDDFPPVSYYWDKLELLSQIHSGYSYVITGNLNVPKDRPRSLADPNKRKDNCSFISQDWGKGDLIHTELLSYKQSELETIASSKIETISIRPPDDLYRYKATISVRSCISNLTDCAKMGLAPLCGLCSEHQTWEWRPTEIQYITGLTVQETRHAEGNSDDPGSNATANLDEFKLTLSFQPDEKKLSLISGYRLEYGLRNSNQEVIQSICFTKLDENSHYRRSYEISLLNNGEYEISLKPITPNGGREIKTFFKVQRKGTVFQIVVGAMITVSVIIILIFLKLAYRCRSYRFSYTKNEKYKNFKVNNDATLKLIRRIDNGKFGKVYEATIQWNPDEETVERVAAKTLVTPVSEQDSELFKEELQMSKGFKNSFIGNSKDLVYLNGHSLYGIFDLYECNLKKYLKRKVNLTEMMMAEVLAQIADAMAYLHSKEIVHRDIAARNILVVKFDAEVPHLKLSDFGMARYLSKGYYKLGSKTNKPLISGAWGAPEILVDGVCNYTAKSDVWAFGILAWEVMNKGEEPYLRIYNSLLELTQHIIKEATENSRFIWPGNEERNRDYPFISSKIILSCTRINPKKRLSFLDLLEILLTRTRSHFKNWFVRMDPFYFTKLENEMRKDSQSTESGISTHSLDASTSQEGEENLSLRSYNEEPPDGEDQRLCDSPDAKEGACMSCAPLSSSFPSNRARN